jgi:hypothetical protein
MAQHRTRSSFALALALAVAASLAAVAVAAAAETTLTADLAGDAETAADGTGSATITLDPETGEACWELSVDGIGAVLQSHIHAGAAGTSGDVVVPLDVDGFDGTSDGCVSDQDADALQAIIDDPASYYVNIHTEDFPGGAIRGQLAGADSPNTAMPAADPPHALIGALLLALALTLSVRAATVRAGRD